MACMLLQMRSVEVNNVNTFTYFKYYVGLSSNQYLYLLINTEGVVYCCNWLRWSKPLYVMLVSLAVDYVL